MHRNALGKGLEALIPGASTDVLDSHRAGATEIPVNRVSPNPFQPRSRFDEETLKELTDSIRVSGVLQPVIVRKGPGGGYQIVAGERRLRAAQLAGHESIPAIVKDVDDRQMLELAIIENVQREDLNPIDEAKGYQALVSRIGLTHDQVSERVGKHRTVVTNALRLLTLPPEVQEMVSRGTLTAGHGRALLGLATAGDQLAAARYVQSKGFSVRRTEAMVNRKLRRRSSKSKPGPRQTAMAEVENRLQQRFATRVVIHPGRKGGTVVFEYYGDDDLERLLEAWAVV